MRQLGDGRDVGDCQEWVGGCLHPDRGGFPGPDHRLHRCGIREICGHGRYTPSLVDSGEEPERATVSVGRNHEVAAGRRDRPQQRVLGCQSAGKRQAVASALQRCHALLQRRPGGIGGTRVFMAATRGSHAVLHKGGGGIDGRHDGAESRVRVLPGMDCAGREAGLGGHDGEPTRVGWGSSEDGNRFVGGERSVTRRVSAYRERRRETGTMLFTSRKSSMIEPDQALRGRDRSVLVNPTFHDIFGIPVQKVPEGSKVAYFGLGCSWGAEKMFWQTHGVSNTAVGYAGGYTPNPTYQEVCSARTGHTEAVKVCYDPRKISYEQLLKIFFENHDPTQGMRQGNDVGTQYRSSIYTTTGEQAAAAERIRDEFQTEFKRAGYGAITTEIRPAPEFYYAEDYHQQYMDKNPRGYCPIHATGVTCNVS